MYQKEDGITYFKRLLRGGPMGNARTAVEEVQELEEVKQYYGKFESSVAVDMKNLSSRACKLYTVLE